jgi:hypothetical protein
MRGDESRVVDAFEAWLQGDGWVVEREIDFVDLVATRNGETLYAEAKGHTASVGLDVDTMYGQLLRRMRDETASSQYAVVVPSGAVAAALRVPSWVRDSLRVVVYEVEDDDTVTKHG